MKRYDNDPDVIAKSLRSLERATTVFMVALTIPAVLVLIGIVSGIVYIAKNGF